MRNVEMTRRIEAARVEYPLRFALAGDSGAYPDPTGDAIFAQLLRQVAELKPLFFINLGDFAGPGTRDRHDAYLRLVEPLEIPNVCVVGNHDLDDPSGRETWERVHGPMNFEFGYGHTRFVVIHACARVGRHDPVEPPDAIEGPRPEDLEFLKSALSAAEEPIRGRAHAYAAVLRRPVRAT